MQKFIEADYYELDWYYEECSDGNYGSCKTERGCVGPLSPFGGGGVLEPSWGDRRREGHGSGTAWLWPLRRRGEGGQQVGRARDGGRLLGSLEMVLACWAREHCTSVGLNSLWGDACVCACVCASGDVIMYGPGTSVFRKWSSGLGESSFPGPRPGSPGEAEKKGRSSFPPGSQVKRVILRDPTEMGVGDVGRGWKSLYPSCLGREGVVLSRGD